MILAHGSGIDDLAWFVVPVVLALVLLRLAERRARRRASDADDGDVTEPADPGGGRRDVDAP